MKIRDKIRDINKIENKHLRRAAFCLAFSCWILEVSIAATLLSAVSIAILWTLAQFGLPGVLLHPELGLLDHLAIMDIKSACIFVSIPLGILLVLAAIEYMEYKYQEIEKL